MNIIVKCDEHGKHMYAKVADFELSKKKESNYTCSNMTMEYGAIQWMAPKLIANSKYQNVGTSLLSKSSSYLNHQFKVGIYSFGMVCYEILTR
jgi:hypothetical protein